MARVSLNFGIITVCTEHNTEINTTSHRLISLTGGGTLGGVGDEASL